MWEFIIGSIITALVCLYLTGKHYGWFTKLGEKLDSLIDKDPTDP